MATVPSQSAEELFDDDEEVLPASAASPPTFVKAPSTAKILPDRIHRGRPVFKVITDKGEGLYSCGNCQLLKTPWRRNTEKAGPKQSCSDLGIKADTKPCSFSLIDPLKKFNPMSFGDIGIGPDMSNADIQLTRLLLKRREDELALAASMPFAIGDKVQFILKNTYTVGIVESFNPQHVYVSVKDPTGTSQILPLTLGSVTKV